MWGDEPDADPDPAPGPDQEPRRQKRESGGGGGDNEDRPAPYRPEELDLNEEAKFMAETATDDFRKYQDQTVTCLPADKIVPITKFEDVIRSKLLLANIALGKFTSMSGIQMWAIPAINEGHDLIGCAQTGSGKTAAFVLPILQNLLESELEPSDPGSDCVNPYALIISPTRELAKQIWTQTQFLAQDSIIKCQVIYGQISTGHIKAQLSKGCHILVATPGRLKDFLNRGWVNFKNIKYIVVDEGDRLVSEGFGLNDFFNHPTMPEQEKRQTLFFSATFNNQTQMSAKEFLKKDFIFLTVGRIGAANEDIKQEFIKVSRSDKKRELKKILATVPEEDKTIIFTQTKVLADMLAGFFTSLNLSSTSIHGDRHQSQREEAIKSFRKGDKRFLISSPVGNRGLDLPKVSLVINYDLPKEVDEYVHRIGRTGRAGHRGRAISFFDAERDMEIVPELIEILKEAKQEIPEWFTSDMSSGAADFGGGGSWDDVNTTTNASANDDWGNPEPSKSATPNDDWANSNTSKSAPANDDWGSSEPSKSAPASDDWGSSKPSNSAPASDDWGSSKTSNSAPASDDWGSSKTSNSAPASDDWGSSKTSNSAPARGDWGGSKPSRPAQGNNSWGNSKRPNSDSANNSWGNSKRPNSDSANDNWGNSKRSRSGPGNDNWNNSRPSNSGSAGGGWGSSNASKPAPASGGWGSSNASKSAPASDGWGSSNASKSAPSSDDWGAPEPSKSVPANNNDNGKAEAPKSDDWGNEDNW